MPTYLDDDGNPTSGGGGAGGDYLDDSGTPIKKDPYGNPIPQMSALSSGQSADFHRRESAENAALDEKFRPKYLDDTPGPGLDNGVDAAAGGIAKFLGPPMTAAVLGPAAGAAIEAGIPATAAFAGKTALGTGLAVGADMGLRKAGVPPGMSEMALLLLGLGGLRGSGANVGRKLGAALENDSDVYMPKLLDTIRRNFGMRSLSSAAENAQGVETGTVPGDATGPARSLRVLDKFRDIAAPPEWRPQIGATNPETATATLEALNTARGAGGPPKWDIRWSPEDAASMAQKLKLLRSTSGLGGAPEWNPSQIAGNPSAAAQRLKMLEAIRESPAPVEPDSGFVSDKGTGMAPFAERNARALRALRSGGEAVSESEPLLVSESGEPLTSPAPRSGHKHGGGGGTTASKVARVSTAQRAQQEAAKIRQLIADATQRLNSTRDPAAKSAMSRELAKLEALLRTRTIKLAGAGAELPTPQLELP